MNPGTLRALEFDRIVASVANLAVTPTGRAQLLQLHPQTEPARVAALQRATSEGTRVLSDHAGFPLRAPQDLLLILDSLAVDGRALEPAGLFALSDYLESIEATRRVIGSATEPYPILKRLVEAIASFATELAHSLGMTVVAEGVETSEMLDLVIDLGVDLVQGFHLHRPRELEAHWRSPAPCHHV